MPFTDPFAETQASIKPKKFIDPFPAAQAPPLSEPDNLAINPAPSPGLGELFVRGLAEGVTGVKESEVDAAKAAEFAKTLGATPEQTQSIIETSAEKLRPPTNWQGKAADFTGKMTGELLGFLPAFGAVKGISAIPKIAKLGSSLGKHALPAVQSGIAGGVQEVGQVLAREGAGVEESAGQKAKDIAISTAVFGGGDYFFRRVLIPAIKAGGGSVSNAIKAYRGQKAGQAAPETGKASDGALNAEFESAVKASGANVDDVAKAADDIAADPSVQAGFAKEATIPDKLPPDVAKPIAEELKRRGVNKLTPEEVMKVRQQAMRADNVDEVAQGIKSATSPDPGTTLPGTAIKVETIADGEDAAKVVSELMKTLPPAQPKTLAEMNSKLTQYGIRNLDDQSLPEVIEEVGLQLRAMESVANDSMGTLYKQIAEGASKDQIKKTLVNSQLLLNSARDARSEFGRQFRSLRPDGRIPAKLSKQLKKEEEKLLKGLDQYLGKGDELPDDLIRALDQLDRNSPEQVVQFLNQFRNPGWWERLGTFRINNLVSAPATGMINVTGNAVQNSMAAMTRPVAAALDAAATPLLRTLGKDVKRDRFLRESSYIWALVEELPVAARASVRAIKYGEDVIGGSKIDLPGAERGAVNRIFSSPLKKGKGNKVLEGVDRVATLPSRLFLLAPDAFMKTMSLKAHRRAFAMQEVLKKTPNATAAERKAEITRLLTVTRWTLSA